jgi:hypothetical protein
MKHSELNVTIRDKDTPQVKDKEGKLQPNPKLAQQAKELEQDILRANDLFQTPGTVNGKNNPLLGWLSTSTFIVELVGSLYEVLSGRHRLDLLNGFVYRLQTAAKNAKTEEERQRLSGLAESWLDFEIACDVRTPKNDDERREIIAEGNPDDNKKAKIVQSYPSRFAAFYKRVPAPQLTAHWTKGAEPKAEFDKDPTAWTNATYQSVTGIRGNFHTTYYALSILGRHFDIPTAFFERGNRLKIVQQVTQALLIKQTPKGEPATNAKTNVFGYGFMERYKQARASCAMSAEKSLAQALDECKEKFKAEFIEILMDGHTDELNDDYTPTGTEGIEALGNVPEKDDAEKEAAEKAKAEEALQEENSANERFAANQPYVFAQHAVARALKVPNAVEIAPVIGNLFDLLLTLRADRFDACAVALATWKDAAKKSLPTAGELGDAAFIACADVMTALSVGMKPMETTETAPTTETVTPKKAKKTK